MREAEVTFDWKMFSVSMFLLAIIVFFVLLSIIVVKMANKRGRSAFGWFFFSLLISPFLGMIFLALLGETEQRRRDRIIEEEELRLRYRNLNRQDHEKFM